MRSALYLAWRYLGHHRGRSLLLITALTLVTVLPVGLSRLVKTIESELDARARSTDLILGSRGSSFDLVLNALYFRSIPVRPLTMAAVQDLMDTGYGTGIPLHVRFSVRGFPVVGTFVDYLDARNLAIAAGRPPAVIGETVVGHEVAESLGLAVGDTVITDQQSLYDLAGTYRVQLTVVGILAPAHSPDDEAVIVDLKTAWILEGIGHGHTPADMVRTDQVLDRSEEGVVLSPAVLPYLEITPETLESFHFHGDPSGYPITGVLVLAPDAKSRTLLKGRYLDHETQALIDPLAVVREVLEIVFRVQRFFELNVALVALSTVLLIGLIVSLTLEIRREEFATLITIGCPRSQILWLILWELALLALGSALGAGVILLLVETHGLDVIHLLVG